MINISSKQLELKQTNNIWCVVGLKLNVWCDCCYREFYYIQMEKYARQALAEGVKNVTDLVITTDSELYRVLVLHYNRNNQIEVQTCSCHTSLYVLDHGRLYNSLDMRLTAEDWLSAIDLAVRVLLQ